MKHRALCVILMAALLCFFAGCGTGKQDDSAAQNTTPTGVESDTDQDDGTAVDDMDATDSAGGTENADGMDNNGDGVIDDVAEGVGDAVEDVGDGVGNAVEDVGDGIGQAVDGGAGQGNTDNANANP